MIQYTLEGKYNKRPYKMSIVNGEYHGITFWWNTNFTRDLLITWGNDLHNGVNVSFYY